MLIEIINVGDEAKVKTYKQYEVVYKDDVGAIKSKKMLSFAYPEVYSAIKAGTKGDKFEVTTEKIDGYWQWTGVVPSDGAAPAASSPAASKTVAKPDAPKGNWETSEERTANRVKIVRQSALNYAVQLVGPKGDINKVFEYAAQFEQWVNRSDAPTGIKAIIEMPDDLVE